MKAAIISVAIIMTWVLGGCASPEKMAIMSWHRTIDKNFSSIEPYINNHVVDNSKDIKSVKFPAEPPATKGEWLDVYKSGIHKHTYISVIGFDYWFVFATSVHVDAIYLGRYDLGGTPGDLFLLSIYRDTWHGTGSTSVTTIVQPEFRLLSGIWIEGINNTAAVRYDNEPSLRLSLVAREDYQIIPAAQEVHIIQRSPDLDWTLSLPVQK